MDIVQNRRPDLVFLDVQMPELNGLEVIAEVGAEHMPLTVFVTAYDEHAIRAFEANAIDYLLKPFSDGRFEMTMARVSIRMDERSVAQNLVGAFFAWSPRRQQLDACRWTVSW